MASYPNMILTLPDPSVTLGPTWAANINTAFGVVDNHDHSSGKGLAVPVAGLNINADLTFQSNRALALKTARFTSQASQPVALTDKLQLYVYLNELYYQDGNGTSVQLTNNGALGGSGGTIGGLAGTTAAATYSDLTKTFSFTQTSVKAAKGYFGDLSIADISVDNGNAVTFKAPASLAGVYTLTLPDALPSGDALMQTDSSGVQSFIGRPSVRSVLEDDGAGTISFATRSVNATAKTSAYTLTATDYVILADASGGAFTLTLPSAVTVGNGKRFILKKVDSSFTQVTVDTTSSQTIDGATSTTLATQYETLTLVSDGANWHVLERRIPSKWVTTNTMTIGGTTSAPTKGTTSIDDLRWRRVGDSMEIVYNYLQTGAGSAGSGSYLFPIPNSLTADTAKLAVNTAGRSHCGSASGGGNSPVDCTGFAFLYNSTNIAIALQGGGTTSNATVGSAAFTLSSATMAYGFSVKVPISGWAG